MENNNASLNDPEKNNESIFSGDEFSMEGYDKHIRQARNAIFTAAGILFASTIFVYLSAPDYEYIWFDVALWGLFIAGFIALGLWTKKKPYYAIIGALILYSLFIIINAAVDIRTIFAGIIFKIMIYVFLIKGLSNAKDAQNMKEQFGKQ
ncbi:MAG: hypothetical protein ABI402_14540 [Ferruginibacter sp.]